MKTNKVSNHYVPQFYLRNFSINRKSVGMIRVEESKYIKEASIKKQVCKDYLYGDNDTIENWFQEIENKVSQIIKKIIAKEELPIFKSEEYDLLLYFMLLSEARNLKTAETMNKFIDSLGKAILKMDQKERFPADKIEETKISFTIPNLNSIKAVGEIHPIIHDLKATLISIENDREFITYDNPLIRYNQFYVKKNYHLRGYGLGNIGIQLFFPISPKLCICLYDSSAYECSLDIENKLKLSKGRLVDEINSLVLLNAYNTVFFKSISKSSLEKLLLLTYKAKRNQIENVTELQAVSQRGKSHLIGLSQKGVAESINLSMFVLRNDRIKMKLPPHMAGPIRPYAQKFIKPEKNEY